MEQKVFLRDVMQPSFIRQSENTYLSGMVLIIKKYDRPLQIFRPPNQKGKRSAPDSSYDRMVVIGENGGKDCFVLVSENAQWSSKMLRDETLTIGSYVRVMEPAFSGSCLGNDRSNPIITTVKPIQVFEDDFVNRDNLAIVSNPDSTAIIHFSLDKRPLCFIQAQTFFPTCTGILCDRRQIKSATACACVQKSPIAGWTIQARVLSESEDTDEDDPLSGGFVQSHALANHFCSRGILRLPVSSINETLLRQAVKRVEKHVNDAGGWFVSGYYKCGLSDESIAQTVQQVRVCRISPCTKIPRSLLYDINPFVPDMPSGHRSSQDSQSGTFVNTEDSEHTNFTLNNATNTNSEGNANPGESVESDDSD